jgi:hypothetical protein
MILPGWWCVDEDGGAWVAMREPLWTWSARRLGSTSCPALPFTTTSASTPARSQQPSQAHRRPRPRRETQRRALCRIIEVASLTDMACFAGRRRRQCRDARDDDHPRLEVPRQLASRERQDVSVLRALRNYPLPNRDITHYATT